MALSFVLASSQGMSVRNSTLRPRAWYERVRGGDRVPVDPPLILVVEDERTLRSALVRLLRRAGYRVIDASCGGEALALVDRHPESIDLLLTDVCMPAMLGTTLAAELRARRGAIRVMYMSGSHERSGFDGNDQFIEKPFHLRELFARLSTILEDWRVASISE
jgi:DNA-binding response OmpR family regulator